LSRSEDLRLTWRNYLRLGERLLELPDAASQSRAIVESLSRMFNAQVNIYLAEPFFPLPGQPPVEILQHTDAPELALHAYLSHKVALDPFEDPTNVAVPLVTQDFRLGILYISRPENPFTAQDLDALDELSANIAMALQIGRQVALKNWRFEQLNLVSSVSAQISNVTNLDELSRRVTFLIQDTFKYYYVGIFTIEPGKEILHFRAGASINFAEKEAANLSFEVKFGDGMVGSVAKMGVEILAPDVKREPRYRFVDALPETKSEFAIPLKIENRILGVLDVQSDQIDGFHEMDRMVLRSMADNVALAVEGARLYTNLKHQADQIAAVSEVGHTLTSILDLDDLLDAVVQTIQKRFGFPYVHIYSVHSGRRKVLYMAGSGARSTYNAEKGISYDLDDPLGIIPWVARNGKTYRSNDVSRDPIYRPSEVPPDNTRSEMGVPLIFGGDIMAVLDLQSEEIDAFNDDDVSLFESLAASLATAYRNASVYRSEQWRRRVAESFRDVSVLLSSNVELDRMLETILVELEKNLPCEASAIWLLEESDSDRETSTLDLAAVHGASPDQLIKVRDGSNSIRSWLSKAMDNNEPSIRNPGDPYGPLGAALNFPPDYSSIAAPLMANGKVLGVLTLAHHTSGRYGSEARSMTTTFASYAAVAIQNARLFTNAQQQAWVSTTLLQFSEAIRDVASIDELFDTTLRMSRYLAGIRKCAVFLWNENEQAFEIKSTYGFDKKLEQSFFNEQEHPIFARLRQTQNMVSIDPNDGEEIFPDLVEINQDNTQVVLPLIVRDNLLGALWVVHQQTRQTGSLQTFNQQSQSILQGVAHQTSVALENLQLMEARQEEAYVTAVLLQVAQAVVSQNELPDILDTIVHLMPILVGIDACLIYLWEPENRCYRVAQAYTGLHSQEVALMQMVFKEGEYSLLDSVRNTDRPHSCYLPDSALPPEEWQTLACVAMDEPDLASQSTSNRWLLGFPLSVKGSVFGIMVTQESGVTPMLQERRLEILNGIAQQTALAIQNERLKNETFERERMEQEFQLARQIQRTFLPNKMPRLHRWEMDARWITARQVGGDFYDIIRLNKGRLGLVIADVSDKGLPAALYMTVTRTLIRAYANSAKTPGSILEHVNELLQNDSQNTMFVTAFCAILDPETGQMMTANAGHNRPYIWRSTSRQLEQLPKGDLALGVIGDQNYTNLTYTLAPGDFLIAFTDGVTECFSPSGDPFGDDRLKISIENNDGRPISQLLDAILEDLTNFKGSAATSDDITFLAVRHLPSPNAASMEPEI